MYTIFIKIGIIEYGDFMNYKKESIISLITFISYLLLSKYASLIMAILGLNNLPNEFRIIVIILYDALLLMGVIFVHLKVIAKDFNDFKRNIKYYINTYYKYWFLNLGLMMISNTLIHFITNITTSTNQAYIVTLLNKYPIYTLITTILIAPITEELIFRLTLRKIFKNDILFILLSGLIFGALHMSVASSLLELLYIIPYSIPGFIFAYTLTKSKNIFVPVSLHFTHNTIMMLLQLLIH